MIKNTENGISQERAENLSTENTPELTSPDSGEEPARRSRPSSLGQMVVDAGILTSEEVANAQETGWRERLPLGRVLVKEGMVLSKDLATLTALHLGLAGSICAARRSTRRRCV
jgi:hypothetical protein